MRGSGFRPLAAALVVDNVELAGVGVAAFHTHTGRTLGRTLDVLDVLDGLEVVGVDVAVAVGLGRPSPRSLAFAAKPPTGHWG